VRQDDPANECFLHRSMIMEGGSSPERCCSTDSKRCGQRGRPLSTSSPTRFSPPHHASCARTPRGPTS
jgi:hypothetical protein